MDTCNILSYMLQSTCGFVLHHSPLIDMAVDLYAYFNIGEILIDIIFITISLGSMRHKLSVGNTMWAPNDSLRPPGIAWINVDQFLFHHIPSLQSNELIASNPKYIRS